MTDNGNDQKQPPGKDTTRSLAALTGGGTNPPLVAVRPLRANQIRQYFQMCTNSTTDSQVIKSLSFGLIQTACTLTAGTALLLGAAPVSVPMLTILGINAGAGLISRPGNKKLRKAFSDAAALSNEDARFYFFNDLRGQYRDAQKQLVALAAAHVNDGLVLDENTLSYLAALPPDLLQGTPEKLAITVLQARQMAGFMRGLCEKPVTCKQLKFLAHEPAHLRFLRMGLADDASGFSLPEENFTVDDFKSSGFPEITPQAPQMGKFAKFATLVIPFASTAWIIRKITDTKSVDDCLEKIAAMEMPALKRIENFSALLYEYQKENGTLDLPALASTPKRITAPKNLLPRG